MFGRDVIFRSSTSTFAEGTRLFSQRHNSAPALRVSIPKVVRFHDKNYPEYLKRNDDVFFLEYVTEHGAYKSVRMTKEQRFIFIFYCFIFLRF